MEGVLLRNIERRVESGLVPGPVPCAVIDNRPSQRQNNSVTQQNEEEIIKVTFKPVSSDHPQTDIFVLFQFSSW